MKMITRKEILQNCPELTYDILQANELALGLIACRVMLNKRNIRYREKEARESLTRLGYWK
jgi:hypothetical protein